MKSARIIARIFRSAASRGRALANAILIAAALLNASPGVAAAAYIKVEAPISTTQSRPGMWSHFENEMARAAVDLWCENQGSDCTGTIVTDSCCHISCHAVVGADLGDTGVAPARTRLVVRQPNCAALLLQSRLKRPPRA